MQSPLSTLQFNVSSLDTSANWWSRCVIVAQCHSILKIKSDNHRYDCHYCWRAWWWLTTAGEMFGMQQIGQTQLLELECWLGQGCCHALALLSIVQQPVINNSNHNKIWNNPGFYCGTWTCIFLCCKWYLALKAFLHLFCRPGLV